ncbi:MAG: undecaprenyldiphospho-muramoylpentapeptide beta-N-acetylglucosaminyltransferase [Gammaproteobacteria bacterium]|nr:undecaprenyldiphospho-muramoylpentapeptide beta-N-acetylglucosaminyltransferase [Gammaproteobacteria bacterium]
MQPKHVVVTGGGTAGHVIPSLPIIERLLEDGLGVSFIGSTSGLEEQLVSHLNIDFYGITTGKLRRYLSLENISDMFRVVIGIKQAFILLWRLRPVVVFSKGGYVAFPVVFAAWLNRIPVVAHESDLTPGLANRLCLPFIKSLCLNFAETKVRTKHTLLTGTAVRSDLMQGDPQKGRDWVAAPEGTRLLVAVGGSLGATALNTLVRGALDTLTESFYVVHVCGAGQVVESLKRPNYAQYEFIADAWGDVLAAADLVVSRSGANALYELLTLRKINILIPLSRRASRGDQIENAEMAERHRWSFVLPEETATPASLVNAVQFVERDRDYWKQNLKTFTPRDSVTLIYEELARVAKR